MKPKKSFRRKVCRKHLLGAESVADCGVRCCSHCTAAAVFLQITNTNEKFKFPKLVFGKSGQYKEQMQHLNPWTY